MKTHYIHKRQTSMASTGFESAIPANDRPLGLAVLMVIAVKCLMTIKCVSKGFRIVFIDMLQHQGLSACTLVLGRCLLTR